MSQSLTLQSQTLVKSQVYARQGSIISIIIETILNINNNSCGQIISCGSKWSSLTYDSGSVNYTTIICTSHTSSTNGDQKLEPFHRSDINIHGLHLVSSSSGIGLGSTSSFVIYHVKLVASNSTMAESVQVEPPPRKSWIMHLQSNSGSTMLNIGQHCNFHGS
eukprot:5143667-Amphidinium_carterae.3